MRIILVLASVLFMSGSLQALEVEGVELPENLSLEGQELVLNGAGVRKKFFFNLYVGSLYLEEKTQDAESVIQSDSPMAIELHIISDKINSDNMTEATLEGFEKATGGNTKPLQGEIDRLIRAFDEEFNEGDSFQLLYLPQKGVKVYKNGELQTSVSGLAFKRALFGIWLGDEPAQQSLKQGMLGN